MMKILVFGMTENPGGVESVIMNYYRNIDRNVFQFDFLCNSYDKIAYEDEILFLGGKTIHFPARSKNPIEYYKKLERFFSKHAKEYKVIWVNVCSLANIDYLKLAKKYGIPKRIIHSHNSMNMDSRLRGMLHKWNKKSLDKYATDFWTCSDESSKWFYKPKLQKKVITIHNAIDISKMAFELEKRMEYRKKLGWEDKFIIGNVGRLHFQKNQEFILDIFEKLIQKNPNARLVLVGQGEDEEILKKKAIQLGIMENVHFAGLSNDIQGWMSTFDFFLFPSKFEGLPLAALEAQASGLPVLASKGVISKNVQMTSNLMFMELDKPAEDWAKQICNMNKNLSRLKYSEIEQAFTKKGYNINVELPKIEKLFSRK